MEALSSALARRQRGVTLIEVLIAILVLSFGLMGLASLQLMTLRNSQSSFDRSRAIMAVYSIADIRRANIGARGSLDTTSAEAQEATWKEDMLKDQLGAGFDVDDISINCAKTTISPLFTPAIDKHICTVTIKWDDSLAGGSSTQELTTQVQL